MTVPALPDVLKKLGLGIGMDMPWNDRGPGFRADPDGNDGIPDQLELFFQRYRHLFRYAFVAFQPRGRRVLRAADYFTAYDRYFSAFEGGERRVRAFHHTILNLGAIEAYCHDVIIEFTNELIDRYQFRWIVEDIGIWSIRGKSLPYPLPPLLTREGMAASIRNVCAYQRDLKAPLSIEFPGFTEGSTFVIGDLDAFDFFAEVARATGCAVTIDVGHIMSWQWLCGRVERQHYHDFDRLPLEHCFELHLSGCRIVGGRFRDLHNGILMDEQIDVLKYLLPQCPNLKAVTYEDPKFTRTGELVPRAQRNFERLVSTVDHWVGET